MAKLFRLAVVLCVAIVSIAIGAVLLTGIASVWPFSVAHSNGIAAVSGGVSEKLLRVVFLLVLLGSLLWWRFRRRSR